MDPSQSEGDVVIVSLIHMHAPTRRIFHAGRETPCSFASSLLPPFSAFSFFGRKVKVLASFVRSWRDKRGACLGDLKYLYVCRQNLSVLSLLLVRAWEESLLSCGLLSGSDTCDDERRLLSSRASSLGLSFFVVFVHRRHTSLLA